MNREIEVHVRANVIETLQKEVAAHPPERGGFLFGKYVENKCFVELFVLDAEAHVSRAVSIRKVQQNTPPCLIYWMLFLLIISS
jgi:hypothetical protein